MRTFPHTGATEVIAILVEPGEMLLESVNAAIAQHDIRNGAVISGIGTMRSLHMHYITHTDFPPHDEFFTIRKPLELVSVSGIIADGEPHLHVTASYKDEEVYAGHLEDNSEVCYLAELVILKFNDLQLARYRDPERAIKLLDRKR